MAHLIDKDAVVAEIERIQNEFSDRNGNFDDLENQGAYKALDRLESSLDTIEVKEVDLEKEIKKVQRKYKTIEEYEGYPCTIYADNIEWIAKHFFELGFQTAQKGE